MDDVQVVVIGAGVIGLAVARQVALSGREVLILEAAERFGSGASSRNSEVIHAGIYYPAGSLKARLCVSGRELLYEYCRVHAIGHRRCGKLIVAATPAQLTRLEEVRAAARANGVALERLTAREAQSLEPQLACAAALHSPLTGIVDAHAYMLALLGEAEQHGATLACASRVTQLALEGETIAVGVNGAAPQLKAGTLINCAGIEAPDVARLLAALPAAHVPRAYLAKGNYFTLATRAPFQRLIYPLPEGGGLGIHLTLDLGGRARFGPDVQWIDACEYDVDAGRAPAFYAAIRRYWPDLADGALQPGYGGLPHRRRAPPRRARTHQPVRHRVTGADGLAGDRQRGRVPAAVRALQVRTLSTWMASFTSILKPYLSPKVMP
jgi:L-2-hydroxyglutarate oxidase LhgO